VIELNEVKKEAEEELRKERMEKAKKGLKELLRKKEQAKQILANIDREIADYEAELGHGNI